MKCSRILQHCFLATFLFSLIACGSNETSTEEAKTDTSSAASSSTASTPVSTISTTPMDLMVATHKVKDFENWHSSYEAHDSMRLANGLHSFVISRASNDPNMVRVAVRVDDMEKAKAFSKNADLKQAMQKGGVTGNPTFKFYRIVFRDSAKADVDLRVSTTITVKDWDKWQKSFDSTRQLTTDNGLAVLGYGHEVDDNHKVLIVSAILDSAKASAYWKSDLLKQRRAASGAGEPTRVVYTVAKRY